MYIVKKPLKLLGKRRWPGDTIEEKDIPNVALLLREGYLSEIPDELPEVFKETGLIIPVSGKDGSEDISVAKDEVVDAFRILQMGAEDAVNALGDTESEEVLKLIINCDHRKTVISAAKARLKVVVGE